jgi:predicted metal-dependent hydrolase
MTLEDLKKEIAQLKAELDSLKAAEKTREEAEVKPGYGLLHFILPEFPNEKELSNYINTEKDELLEYLRQMKKGMDKPEFVERELFRFQLRKADFEQILGLPDVDEEIKSEIEALQKSYERKKTRKGQGQSTSAK